MHVNERHLILKPWKHHGNVSDTEGKVDARHISLDYFDKTDLCPSVQYEHLRTLVVSPVPAVSLGSIPVWQLYHMQNLLWSQGRGAII